MDLISTIGFGASASEACDVLGQVGELRDTLLPRVISGQLRLLEAAAEAAAA